MKHLLPSSAATVTTVLAAAATTLTAGLAITFGLSLMIRGHNARRTLRRFRRKKGAVARAVRAEEARVSASLVPSLADLTAATATATAAASTSSLSAKPSKISPSQRAALVKRLKEVDELLLRCLERLDQVRPAEMAEDLNLDWSTNPRDPSPVSKVITQANGSFTPKRSASISSTAEASDASTLIASPVLTPSFSLDETDKSKLFNQLEVPALPSTLPPAAAASPAFTESAAAPANKPSSFFSVIVQSLWKLIPTTLAVVASSLFAPTDQLPKEYVTEIREAVVLWRSRKRALVKKVQAMSGEVDILFESLVVAQ